MAAIGDVVLFEPHYLWATPESERIPRFGMIYEITEHSYSILVSMHRHLDRCDRWGPFFIQNVQKGRVLQIFGKTQ